MATSRTIYEVWLFGSAARQELTDKSDIDLLVVSDLDVLPVSMSEQLKKCYGQNIDVAHYSYAGLDILVQQGALFAWHLRDEAVPVRRDVDRLRKMLAEMNPYVGHRGDLEVLLNVFDEAVASLKIAKSVQFDLGVVGTVIRNTGIIMHHLFGSRDYSPAAPVRLESVHGAPTLPIRERDYDMLNACRHASERGMAVRNIELCPLGKLTASFEPVRSWLRDCINCTSRGN